jgi:transcriptional regulator with XRE-family HTH domain
VGLSGYPHLREFRERKGLTQRDLAERTRLLGTTISRIENGHRVPSVAVLERIAASLDIPLYQLLQIESDPAAVLRGAPFDSHVSCMNADLTAAQNGEFLVQFMELCSGISDPEREMLLALVVKVSKTNGRQLNQEITDPTQHESA